MNKEAKQTLIVISIIFFLIVLSLPLVTSINLLDWLKDLGTITGMASSETHTVTLSVSGYNPNISNVSISSTTWSITEGGTTIFTFSFTASDFDGVNNLDNSTAEGTINFTIGSESVTRKNDSCTAVGNVGTDATNYSCEIPIFFWEMNGTWTINASICDDQGGCTQNVTRNFSLGATGSIQIAPTAINFGSLTKSSSNNSATDDPILINNTGNINVTADNVRVTGNDLAGADTTTIGAGNFTASIGSDCDFSTNATKLVNATATGITRSGLARGNVSNVDPANSTYQEQLYFCFFATVPTYLTPQTYDTTAGGAWTIGIV